MGSARDAAVKGYIRLPNGIRKHTDPLVRNRAKTQAAFQRRREKGKQTVKGGVKRFLMGTKRSVKKI